jgi:hypothetical protein
LVGEETGVDDGFDLSGVFCIEAVMNAPELVVVFVFGETGLEMMRGTGGGGS